jgi:hypothetical protein
VQLSDSRYSKGVALLRQERFILYGPAPAGFGRMFRGCENDSEGTGSNSQAAVIEVNSRIEDAKG